MLGIRSQLQARSFFFHPTMPWRSQRLGNNEKSSTRHFLLSRRFWIHKRSTKGDENLLHPIIQSNLIDIMYNLYTIKRYCRYLTRLYSFFNINHFSRTIRLLSVLTIWDSAEEETFCSTSPNSSIEVNPCVTKWMF